ncbi:MAG: SUMF1/EgtB/PvdO family nonheme iron enzyme [Kiritimatiellia bacterium]|nr:SUMF1/EgtB/PvdO family nonheme iron enzyme [Kiritimatiellia bacterium]
MMKIIRVGCFGILAAGLAGCGGSAPDQGARQTDESGGPRLPHIVETPSGVKMAYIPAGTFRMGDHRGNDDEKPEREVTITQSFYMDVMEVRQSHFERFMGLNPAKFVHPARPVEQVRWHEAAEYCNARSRAEGLPPCYDETTWACNDEVDGYRLPTEAEWEYAARAGTGTAYFYGARASAGDAFVWAQENAGRTTQEHPKRANPRGLSDMLGNLWEWCNDIYDPEIYATGPATDPRGATEGDRRVLRGGAWNMPMADCRPAARRPDDPANADICAGYDTYGFRAVRRATPWPEPKP